MDHVVQSLKEWSFRIAVIISLVAHVYLILFARIRRCRPFPSRRLLRGLLWLFYQLADWAPGYVLGNLYLEDRSTKNLIVAFWVPFLLLNIRPDNISAYASEDNKLSSRQYVSFGLQFFGAMYVLFRHDFTGTAGTLRCASIIMYVYGIAKYFENLIALRRGDLKRIQKRFEKKKKKKRSKCFCPFDLECREGTLCYQKARLIAHDLLLIPVGDGDIVHPSISSYGYRDIVKVVEMEVQLLYDLIYTKTAVVYTWHGYLLRLASPFLTTTALVLFSFQCREGADTKDVTVTFTLLITTLVLDLMWLVITLGSTWTYAYLKDKPGHWLHAQVNFGGRWHQLRRILVSLDPCRLFVMEPRRYSSWPDKTEQRSMLKMVSTGKTAQEEIDNRKNHEAIPRAWRDRHQESQNLMEEAKDLLFSRIWESLKSANSTGPKETTAKKAGLLRRTRPLGEALPFGPEIQEVMLSWHMATEMFRIFSIESDQTSRSVSVYVKAVTTLSNHLIFLAAECPEMLPGLQVHRLFQSTKHTLEKVWSNKPEKPSANREKDLAVILREIRGKHPRKQVIGPSNYVMDPRTQPCQPFQLRHPARDRGKASKEKEDDSQDQELNSTILDDPTVSAKTRSIILDGRSFSEVLIHVASGEEDMSACLNRMEETTKDRFLKLMPEFGDTLDKLDIPVILDLMFDTWVRMVIHAALLCSTDSHEKQLSRGSEFLTIIWILTAHAGIEDHID